MGRIGLRRDLLTVLLIAFVIATLASLPLFDRLHGLSIDVLTWLRWRTVGQLHDPAKSPTTVVALDEETYRRKPFAGTPSITWTPAMAKALTEVVDAGAKVVGFDVIFPTSLEQSEIALGTTTVGERLRGFDRDFLRALSAASRQGKLVLGQVQHLHKPIQPFEAQRIAVGNYKNIRPLNLHADPDGVVRRVPLSFDVDGKRTMSMAVELALRAAGEEALAANYGADLQTMSRVHQGPRNTLTLNFDGGADDIPTYSLADLVACAESGNKEYFRRQFKDRVVLFGAVLDVEDRSVASKRFATGIEGAKAERCLLPYEPGDNAFARDSIAGVYVHATAVNNLIRGDALREPGHHTKWLINFVASALAAALALRSNPLADTARVAALAAVWIAIATWAFTHAFALPLVEPIMAAFLSLSTMIAFRFMVADSDKRLLRSSFALYLSPTVIDRMLATNTLPRLGGETRAVTVYFSDIAGFSKIAEGMTPGDLVALMNEYLSAMTDTIESHGGFVDKYIGDAIVAVFGAPADDLDHAGNAVRAALACQAKLGAMNKAALAVFAGVEIKQRVGLNSGDTLVGNIGSRRRFNYTVMGDTVNLAARLESANKYYGTSIMASDATVALAGDAIAWRELDTITVVGRATPTRIFEPLDGNDVSLKSTELARQAYAEGLTKFRSGDFAGAAGAFGRAAGSDPPSAAFLARALELAADPAKPRSDVRVLDDK